MNSGYYFRLEFDMNRGLYSFKYFQTDQQLKLISLNNMIDLKVYDIVPNKIKATKNKHLTEKLLKNLKGRKRND